MTASDTFVTFTVLDGQVVTFSEYSTNATFIGTDRNNGGCAAGKRGRVTGINISNFVNQLNGASITSAQEMFNLAGDNTSSHSASTEASF